MNKLFNNKKGILVVFCLVLLMVVLGVSLALFTYSRIGETKTTIVSGDIAFTFKDKQDITLTNAFPLVDSIGASDNNYKYEFDVSLTASKDVKANYTVTLLDNNKDADKDYFNNEAIKFNLKMTNGSDTKYIHGSETTGIKLTYLDGFDKESHEGMAVATSKEIYSGETHKYELRIWISDDVDYNTNIETDGTMNGKYNSYMYSLKVKVDSGVTEVSTSKIKVTSKDINGNNLHASANDIKGEEKDILLTSLKETGYIKSVDEVDALIEVKSDKFEDLADTEFDVAEIARDGDKIAILHFDEEKGEWELIGIEEVVNGKVGGDFRSYSPVAFVILSQDGEKTNIYVEAEALDAIPVYHVHTGNSTNGGGCYGNRQSSTKKCGGYVANYGGESVNPQHSAMHQSLGGFDRGYGRCQSCGAIYCFECGEGQQMYEGKISRSCTKSVTVYTYSVNCGKNATTIDSYKCDEGYLKEDKCYVCPTGGTLNVETMKCEY